MKFPDITRRDFLTGAAVAIGGTLLPPAELLAQARKAHAYVNPATHAAHRAVREQIAVSD